ncbi:MAG: porin [Chitinophagaceae bacterium]
MLRKFFSSAMLLACYTVVSAQDSTKPKLLVSGYVDVYYRYNFQNAKSQGATNNATSFTNSQNSFELGMASVKLEHSFGKVGVVADLGFGKRAEEFSYNDSGTLLAVKQAYITYAPSDKIKFTAGSWGTHVGYEVLDPYLNRNYSMSYMFSYGPFFHTGVKADVTLGNFGIMLGIVNPTDLKSANFQRKFLIGQLSAATSNGKLKAFLNYQGGKYEDDTKVKQVDLTVTGTVSDKFSVGYNGTVQSVKPSGGDAESWWGSAVYLNYDPTAAFGLTLRGEYFDDKKAVSGGAFGTSIFATTLSGNIRIGNLTVIPELRLDSAKDPYFVKNSGAGTKSASSFLLAAIYHF